jgi:DNA-binding GntR family transcriptional regulator
VELRTIASQVAEHLRGEILAAKLPPGARLLQDEEARRLGVSRTPVREAFKQLEAERLIELIPNRGAVVSRLSSDAVRDLYFIRSHVESLAVSEAAQKVTPVDLEEIDDILRVSEGLSPGGDRAELLALNKRFHFRIYEASRLPPLVSIISSLWAPIEAVRAAYVSVSTLAGHAVDEHRRLYEALQRRDGDAAGELTRRHILATADVVIGWMEAGSEAPKDDFDGLGLRTA